MTPVEALRNILTLVDGSDEVEDGMTLRRVTFARLLFAAACLCAPPAFADNLTGQTSIIDGDTLEIHGTRIRLWGIDAPESSQLCRDDETLQYQCGAKAANELDAFIARRPVDCSPVSLDRYGCPVAVAQSCRDQYLQ